MAIVGSGSSMQRRSEKTWFRRRAVGLGWRPVAWQGWLVTVLVVALVIGVFVVMRQSPARFPIVILTLAVYAMVALATGGNTTGEESPAAEEEPPPPEAVANPVRTEVIERPATPRRRQLPGAGPQALVVEGLTKRFAERVAVEDVSFSVASGEVFGFLGPNGAGKTTTVRMLGTLIAPSSGTAVVAGIPLEPANGVEIRQRISVMPETPGLYLRLTVAENLEFFAGLYELRDGRDRIAAALEAVNLGARADDACGSLSKGLRQRVGLARALLNDPAIVFLDEPTSGLDPVATREVHELIDGLRERGVTVFLTTHRLDEAERLCDRVAILNTSLRTIGRPEELRDRLFRKTLVVQTAAALSDPGRVFADLEGVESWHSDDSSGYVLTVSDPRAAAPAVARALVAAGADILSIGEERRSLEDVYLELIDDDVEARR
jgi:ABC-2 type transport system ATP-binding protein